MIIRLCKVCHLQVKPTPVTKRDRIWCKSNGIHAKSVTKEVEQSIVLPTDQGKPLTKQVSTSINGKRQDKNE